MEQISLIAEARMLTYGVYPTADEAEQAAQELAAMWAHIEESDTK